MERTNTNTADTGNTSVHRGEERINALFQPDTLLPDQYLDTQQRTTFLEPEKRLMLAVLDDAVNCYRENLFSQRGKDRRLFDEAEEWILTRGGDRAFSFDNVCESLGLNPEYLRRGLQRLKETQRQNQSASGSWHEDKLAS
jgi:hypothetical protein